MVGFMKRHYVNEFQFHRGSINIVRTSKILMTGYGVICEFQFHRGSINIPHEQIFDRRLVDRLCFNSIEVRLIYFPKPAVLMIREATMFQFHRGSINITSIYRTFFHKTYKAGFQFHRGSINIGRRTDCRNNVQSIWSFQFHRGSINIEIENRMTG
jgi:hypothetical protein